MDRKALIREYKASPRPMGVYRVRQKASGKSLVGATVDLPAMLNRVRFQLNAGVHPNAELQRDWQRLGPDAFDIDVVDTLKALEEPGYDPREDLEVLEQLWLQKLSPWGESGYNGQPKPAK